MKGKKHNPSNTVKDIWRCQNCLKEKHQHCLRYDRGFPCYCMVNNHLLAHK
jgi:hypothetical protein